MAFAGLVLVGCRAAARDAGTVATGTTMTSTSTPTPTSTSTPSFGPALPISHYTCPVVLRGGGFRSFLATADARLAFVDGDDPLALVNRSPTGALPPDYVPSDLVDVRDGSSRLARDCEGARPCLRREAAKQLRAMLDRMKAEGVEGHIASAYRGFGTQCWVFSSWARQAHGGFCEATEQSALPGHSQHQLGTTVDLFTREWADEGAKSGRGVFRDGFGCSPGGKWLDENSWTFGFVVSYPIDPDDRRDGSRCLARVDRPVPIDPKTGYKSEPWHVRYIGTDDAALFHQAWLASGPGSPSEVTLEQWLRARRGLLGDAELPVCDGCQCGACSTLAEDDRDGLCHGESLRLGENGLVKSADDEPQILDAHAVEANGATLVDVSIRAAAHTPTQTPATTADGPTYTEGATFERLVPYAGSSAHPYPDLPGAWRVGVSAVPEGAVSWPWRASLARGTLAATWNRANVVLPAKAGDSNVRIRVVLPSGATGLRVTLLRDGVEHGSRDVTR
jgi:D-alanyl-D-alanine carboxypeptidase